MAQLFFIEREVMFTGLIKQIGVIQSMVEIGDGVKRLNIEIQGLDDVKIGDSIAIDGACLTITKIEHQCCHFDLSNETINSTTFSSLKVGDRVHCEQALKASDRLGGHFVTGHVDETIELTCKRPIDDCLELSFAHVSSNPNKSHIQLKGSVTINGVSLTVQAISENDFSTVLIPETLKRTLLGGLSVGQQVNIEYDLLSKMVRQHLNM